MPAASCGTNHRLERHSSSWTEVRFYTSPILARAIDGVFLIPLDDSQNGLGNRKDRPATPEADHGCAVLADVRGPAPHCRPGHTHLRRFFLRVDCY